MIFDSKLAICAVASLVAHFVIARALELLPEQHDLPRPHKIDIRVVPAPELPPPPEPPKPPDPVPPPPAEVHDAPKPRVVKTPTVAPVAKDAPPPDHPAVTTTDTTEQKVFGVDMNSTSAVGTGPAMPTGNTTRAEPGPGAPNAKPLAAPVAAFEATKMPLPQGRCFGKYTEEARAAGTEGTVVLDLIVGEDGHVRDVQVVEKLGNGLTEAAVKAARECQFSPGEKDGKPVAVRVRGFKIRFVLADPT